MQTGFFIFSIVAANAFVAMQGAARRNGYKTAFTTRDVEPKTKRQYAAGQWAAHAAVTGFVATAFFVVTDHSEYNDLLVFPAAFVPGLIAYRLALKYLPHRKDDDDPGQSGILQI